MAARKGTKRGGRKSAAKKATTRTRRSSGGSKIERKGRTLASTREGSAPREMKRAATTRRARRATDAANNPNGIPR